MEQTQEHIWNNEEPQPIAVPLLGHHAPHNGNTDHQRDYGFVGRDHLINELITILKETRDSKGCYLISGFRGTGKTTLINKVLYLYAHEKTGPAWLPDVGEKNYYDELRSILDKGLKKLQELKASSATPENISTAPKNQHKGTSINPLKPQWRRWKWATTIKKYFISGQVITVRINLGQDESLSSRDVLFNTATLLHHKLRDKRRYFELIPILVITSLLTLIAEMSLGEGFRAWLSKTLAEPSLPAWLDWLNLPAPIGSYFNSLLFIGFGVWVAVYCLWSRCLPTSARILLLLKRLEKRMAYAVELNKSVRHYGFSLNRKETMPPLDSRQIENELLHILKQSRNVFRPFVRPDIIFIFDELDKIAHRPDDKTATHVSVGRDLQERKKKVDNLLGTLKNFITHGDARFFFIAGREMLDSYQAERGSTSSLYESLFSRVFEVPSLLTDPSDHNKQRMHSLLEVYLCRKLMDPDVAICLWLWHKKHLDIDDLRKVDDLHRKLMYSPFCLRTYYHYLTFVPGINGVEARRIVLGLRNFIQFLTLHSWGNPKRMMLLFDHFTKPVESVDWRQTDNVTNIMGSDNKVTLALQFGLLDQQRIVLASNLYIHLYHDLGRQLTSSGDKLAVSTMAAVQYILKFHRHPFSRYHLERMSETLSVYHSPELSTMIDTLVSKVFHQHIRRIRNSHYRYRFSGDFEQELRYISRVSDIESATFNFSLDAAAPIKAHYIDQLKDMTSKGSPSRKSSVAVYELCMIIGDLFALEQSHDEAFTYYQRAVDVFDLNKCPEDLRLRFTHFYVEALLRLGEIYEQRQRYDQAASVYLQADSAVNKLRTGVCGKGHDVLSNGDSKWDLFRQPFWARWFLHLKRSPVSSRGKLPPPFEYPFNSYDDRVNHYRAGQLAFFYGRHYTATQSFIRAIKHSGIKDGYTERTTYLGAYAYLHLGENLFVGMMRYLWDKVVSKSDRNLISLKRRATLGRRYILKNIVNSIKSLDNIESLDGLERKFSDKSESYLLDLSRVMREEDFLKIVDVSKTLGMMAHAAKLLTERGLHYHAAFSYLKILSLWGMLSEVLFVLTEVGNHVESGSTEKNEPLHRSRVARILKQSEVWIAEVRRNAHESIANLTIGGFDRFRARWTSRDVDPIRRQRKDQSAEDKPLPFEQFYAIWKNDIEELLNKQQKLKPGFELTSLVASKLKLDNALDILFPNNDNKQAGDLVREPIFLQRSMMGQKLIHLSTWEYMANIRFTSSGEPLAIPHQNIVPHSTRNLMFFHWLTGRRYLHWEVLDKLKNIENSTLSKDDEEKKLKKIYDASAAAVHNLHRAIYYIRQLSGNDQKLMFPDPSMVLYDLWCLLYNLIKWDLKKTTTKKTFDKAVEYVKEELSSSDSRREKTPGNFYDFHHVTLRTIDALRDVENLGDITSRVRTDALKTRHFLADDYEDPSFQLDWVLVQMYGPTAEILRCYVESARDVLIKDFE